MCDYSRNPPSGPIINAVLLLSESRHASAGWLTLTPLARRGPPGDASSSSLVCLLVPWYPQGLIGCVKFSLCLCVCGSSGGVISTRSGVGVCLFISVSLTLCFCAWLMTWCLCGLIITSCSLLERLLIISEDGFLSSRARNVLLTGVNQQDQ